MSAVERLAATVDEALLRVAPGLPHVPLCNDLSAAILAADPALAEALELGLAWQAAEAALPEGWRMGSLRAAVGFNGVDASTVGWTATAHSRALLGDHCEAYAATPAEALRNLAVKLKGEPE